MYSVLCVDDEPRLLEVTKLFLEDGGKFKVTTTTSAREALERLNTVPYDAIISDYQMPGMDGIEFLKKLKASGNTLPFIIFTGRGREEVAIDALNNGADFYIQKGGDPTAQFAELSDKIRYAVSKRQYEKNLEVNEVLEKEMKFHELELLKYITEIKQMDEAIHTANRKLNLLNRIIRHDILNTVTGLLGLEDMAMNHISDQDALHLLREIKDSTRLIQEQITFTRDYQDIGLGEPQWQNVHRVISDAIRQTSPGNMHLSAMADDGLEIFADAMLIKVFYNLIDNALRHGGKLSKVTFSSHRDGDNIIISCRDDGDGIADSEKEKIFESGFGKNTGQGLFLAREILNITGISIKETGKTGEGARFDMLVPKEAWRLGKTGKANN
jgi:DNA-binding response OmpR family regulator